MPGSIAAMRQVDRRAAAIGSAGHDCRLVRLPPGTLPPRRIAAAWQVAARHVLHRGGYPPGRLPPVRHIRRRVQSAVEFVPSGADLPSQGRCHCRSVAESAAGARTIARRQPLSSAATGPPLPHGSAGGGRRLPLVRRCRRRSAEPVPLPFPPVRRFRRGLADSCPPARCRSPGAARSAGSGRLAVAVPLGRCHRCRRRGGRC